MKVLINQFLKIFVTGMDHGSGKLPGKTQGIGESRIDLNRFKKTQKQDHGQSIGEKFDLFPDAHGRFRIYKRDI